ncbi:MAG: alpha-E domain-containing protein [Nevskiales bacterium]|nr:alpha-E domain-containing protein [Nevskiales bacterium]
MLSRVAEDLYWFGRYLQRAENTARLISVHSDVVLDLPRKFEFGWSPLVEIFGVDQPFKAAYGNDFSEANVVRFLILDEDNPSSIANSLKTSREILRTVREALPQEIWEHLNDLHLLIGERGERYLPRSKRIELLRKVSDTALYTYGVLVANMSHDVGFQFMRIGTNLEQADMTTRIIDVRTSSLIKPSIVDEGLRPFQNIQWMNVLNSLTAYQMYRRHERSRVRGTAVLSYLTQDREFPRAVMFCLNMIGSTLPHLPPNRAIERTLERTRALVRDANLERLVESGLHDWLDEIQVGIGRLHESISSAYFDH